MDSKVRGALLLGAGFLMGTVGIKALTSQQARRCYVKGVACGLRAKDGYERIVEEAKAEADDIVAEASYINASSAKASTDDPHAETAKTESVAEKPATQTA